MSPRAARLGGTAPAAPAMIRTGTSPRGWERNARILSTGVAVAELPDLVPASAPEL